MKSPILKSSIGFIVGETEPLAHAERAGQFSRGGVP